MKAYMKTFRVKLTKTCFGRISIEKNECLWVFNSYTNFMKASFLFRK
jgi:hypothetical protein